MDPFDEFEFKPLTEGLGFHNKKSESAPATTDKIPARHEPALTKSAATFQATLSNVDLDLVAPEAHRVPIQSPLPRAKASSHSSASREEIPLDTYSETNAKVDEILRTLGERKKYDFKDTKIQPPKVITWSESRPEFSAALLDSMLVFAGYLASLIILLVVTKVDLFANLAFPDSERSVFMGLGLLLGSIIWIYLVATRLFLGQTPGEWVFDQRLGRPEQVGRSVYSLKVAARSLLVMATGLVVLPLISWIWGKDFAGRAVGLSLVRKV